MNTSVVSVTKATNLVLKPHPESTSQAVSAVEANLSLTKGSEITVGYILRADLERLLIPPPQTACRSEGLWQHTCFELFIGAKNDVEYYEFNFSPSGEWATYEFRNYRDGSALDADGLEPAISVRRAADILELDARIRLNRLPGLQLDVGLWLGLSAVIEDNHGQLSYWALKHPPGKPDFHHPDSFTFELPFPSQEP